MSYSQPPEAPFSHDSIELADRASSLCTRELRRANSVSDNLFALDLCAGCGVVGLEFERRLRKKMQNQKRVVSWTFLEVQEVYRSHFEQNLHGFLAGLSPEERGDFNAKFLLANYRDVPLDSSLKSKFSLILSNPPYFEEAQGRLPPNPVKARSRFFLDANFDDFIRALNWCLHPRGQAIFLIRDLEAHRVDRLSRLERASSEHRFFWESLEPIRGTGLVRVWPKI
jgi:tRNA1Val (adenine37-N6)-methyltransferase